ncbi:hypothetical protein AHF37_08931 [Paragonimus kellicotti]|nr:hypothetical protein AHF37_08931 [Paragonimus kellicotti]
MCVHCFPHFRWIRCKLPSWWPCKILRSGDGGISRGIPIWLRLSFAGRWSHLHSDVLFVVQSNTVFCSVFGIYVWFGQVVVTDFDQYAGPSTIEPSRSVCAGGDNDALVNHYISQRYGSRPVVVAGALGSCISLLVAAFSPNLALWVVAIGVGVGASLSCIYFTVFSVIGRCFRRYLGLANGISVAGLLMPRYIVDPDDPKTFPIPKGKKSKSLPVGHSTNRLRRRLLRKGRRSPADTELTADSTLVSMDAMNVEKTKEEGFAHLYTEIVDKQQ